MDNLSLFVHALQITIHFTRNELKSAHFLYTRSSSLVKHRDKRKAQINDVDDA